MEETKMNNVINDDPKVYQDALENGIICYINDKKEEAILAYSDIVNYYIKEITSEGFLLIKSEQLKNNVSFCRDCLKNNGRCYQYFSQQMQKILEKDALRFHPWLFSQVPHTEENISYYKELYLTTKYPIENKDREKNERRLMSTFPIAGIFDFYRISILQILAETKTGSVSHLSFMLIHHPFFNNVHFAKQCVELNPNSLILFKEEVKFNLDIIHYLNSLPRHLISENLIRELKLSLQVYHNKISSNELANELEKLLGMKIEVKNKSNSTQSNKITVQGYKQYKEQKNSQNQHNNNYHNNRQNNGGYHKSNNGNRYNNKPRQNDNRNNNHFKAPWQEQLEEMLNGTKNNKSEMGED